jgi:ElaB/YqjD/DUF883 family membrane-anchored ribosome-binding protein
MTTEYGKSTNYNTNTSNSGYEQKSETDKLRQEGSAAADQAKQSSKETINRVGEQVRQTVDQAKQQGEARFEEEKQRTADEVGEVAKTLHHTAEQLGSQEHGNIANYVDVAAEQLDRVSSAIRNQDLQGVVNQVENFARQQPAVFLGAAVAAGVFAGRFLKSSAARNNYAYDDDYAYNSSYADDYVDYDDDDGYTGEYAYGSENDADDRLEHSSKYGYPLAPNEVITDDEPYDPVVTSSEPEQVSGFDSKPASTPAMPTEKTPPRTPITDIPSSDSPLSSDSSKNKTYP